jgi:hypothetical protein
MKRGDKKAIIVLIIINKKVSSEKAFSHKWQPQMRLDFEVGIEKSSPCELTVYLLAYLRQLFAA